MNLDELLLNIHNVDFSSLVRQTDIQTEANKQYYEAKNYRISLTEKEFKDRFDIDPSCIWYAPSISTSCLYFNESSLAAAPFHLDLILSGQYFSEDMFVRAIKSREEEVANLNFSSSVSSLPDGMRMEYFKRLVEKHPDCPGLYDLFFSHYLQSDYGFGNLDSSALNVILSAKTPSDAAKTKEQLSHLPDVISVYRGGNTASTPAEQAYSWTLDVNVANFFACRRGTGEGYIVEGTVRKEDVIDAFITDRDEKELIVDPKNVKITEKIPVWGIDFIGPKLADYAPIYHKYLKQMQSLKFAQHTYAHGYEHQARVLLLSLTLADLLALPPTDKHVLATAAIYHDLCRTNDVDDNTHGAASKEYYLKTVSNPDPLVAFLCEYHCLPDEEGYREIINNRQLCKNRNSAENFLTRAKLLYMVFKDADALDRVRFNIKNLDLNQLRIPVSKELTLVARLYLEQLRFPEVSRLKKGALSSRIQVAESRASQRNSHQKNCKTQEPVR